jgi:hypothetical protein
MGTRRALFTFRQTGPALSRPVPSSMAGSGRQAGRQPLVESRFGIQEMACLSRVP